jgi:hypothetical protein
VTGKELFKPNVGRAPKVYPDAPKKRDLHDHLYRDAQLHATKKKQLLEAHLERETQ